MQERFQIGLFELAQKVGIGFYATQSEIKFIRPIKGLISVEVESYVREVIDESTLRTPFKIFNNQSGKIYSEGQIDFSIVDVNTGWKTPINEKIGNLLFE